MNNDIAHQICKIATRAAMNGTPLETIQWVPPQSAASDPAGTFILSYAGPLSASQTPPWER